MMSVINSKMGSSSNETPIQIQRDKKNVEREVNLVLELCAAIASTNDLADDSRKESLKDVKSEVQRIFGLLAQKELDKNRTKEMELASSRFEERVNKTIKRHKVAEMKSMLSHVKYALSSASTRLEIEDLEQAEAKLEDYAQIIGNKRTADEMEGSDIDT